MMHANGNWGDVLVDSVIAGGAAFFGVLSAHYVATQTLPHAETLYGAAVAFGVALFASLIAARRRTAS